MHEERSAGKLDVEDDDDIDPVVVAGRDDR